MFGEKNIIFKGLNNSQALTEGDTDGVSCDVFLLIPLSKNKVTIILLFKNFIWLFP